MSILWGCDFFTMVFDLFLLWILTFPVGDQFFFSNDTGAIKTIIQTSDITLIVSIILNVPE